MLALPLPMEQAPLTLVASSKTFWAIGRSVPAVLNARTSAAAASIRLATAVSSAPL